MAGTSATTWHMLVADVFLLESSGREYWFAIVSFFLLATVLGVPLSWHKTFGGDTLVWVSCYWSLTKLANRGNGAALKKLMSTKYPSSALLMEMSSFVKKSKLKALVVWAPRDSNTEADACANGVTADSNPDLEMRVDVENLSWCNLCDALLTGRQAEEAFKSAKEQGRLADRAKKERRKRLEDRLRMKDPW